MTQQDLDAAVYIALVLIAFGAVLCFVGGVVNTLMGQQDEPTPSSGGEPVDEIGADMVSTTTPRGPLRAEPAHEARKSPVQPSSSVIRTASRGLTPAAVRLVLADGVGAERHSVG